jgi:hypothetical protein
MSYMPEVSEADHRMDKYKFARLVLVSCSGVTLYTTAPSLIEWVQKTVKEMFPQCHQSVDKLIIGPKGKNGDLPRGQQFVLHLSSFQNADTDVAFWLVDQLCGQGWEPFAANDIAQASQSIQKMIFYFRRNETAA